MKQLSLFSESVQENSGNQKNIWKIFVDGASRNNPGKSGAGVFILKNDKPAHKTGYFLGIKTNNQAEYLAVLLGIFFMKKDFFSGDEVLIVSDSQLLIRQFQGMYKVKHPELRQLHELAKFMLKGIDVNFLHVLRENNKVADELANEGIDKKNVVPSEFITVLKEHGISF